MPRENASYFQFSPNKTDIKLEASPKLQEKINALGEKLPAFTRTLLQGLSLDNEKITPAKRATMLKILTLVPLGKLDSDQTTNDYASAVQMMEVHANVEGPVNDMLIGGMILSSHISKELKNYQKITKSWKTVIETIKDQPEWKSVGLQYLDLEEAIRPDEGTTVINYSAKKLLHEYNQGYAAHTIAAHMGITKAATSRGLKRLRQLGLLPQQKPNSSFRELIW